MINQILLWLSLVASVQFLIFIILDKNNRSITNTNRYVIKEEGGKHYSFIVYRVHALFPFHCYEEIASYRTIEEAFESIELLKQQKPKTIYKTKK
jgi:hypothetical protein